MDKEPKATLPARRVFLKTTGLGAGTAAAGVLGKVALDAPQAAAEASWNADGYRETAHIRRFYELGKKF